jgi:hypothetical protein
MSHSSGKFFYLKNGEDFVTDIEFIPSPKFRLTEYKDLSVSSICTLLGNDTLGVVPSNYCFYFKAIFVI